MLSVPIGLVDTRTSGPTYYVLVFALLATSPGGVFCSSPPNLLSQDGFLVNPRLVFIFVVSGPVASSLLKPIVNLYSRPRRGGRRLR